MRILHTVESYHPSGGGMAEVVRQVSERLVAAGHEVTVASSSEPDSVPSGAGGVRLETFRIRGNAVHGYDATETELQRYREFLKCSVFDIVANFAAQQWATDLSLPILKEITARKVFIPTGFSALYDRSYRTYFRRMARWMLEYDANVVSSYNYRDAQFARRNGISKVVMIPNGADAEEFREPEDGGIRKELSIPSDALLVLSVGSHTGLKGHDELIEVFSRARITNSVLLIAGNPIENDSRSLQSRSPKDYVKALVRFPYYRRFHIGHCPQTCTQAEMLNARSDFIRDKKRVLVRSLTRGETVACFKAADLFVFPSNIECSPIVLFESLASRTPFLSSSAGNAQEIVEWSGGGKLLPTVVDRRGFSHVRVVASSRMLEQLAANRAEREILADRGRRVWEERFTWDKIAAQYEHLYKSLA